MAAAWWQEQRHGISAARNHQHQTEHRKYQRYAGKLLYHSILAASSISGNNHKEEEKRKQQAYKSSSLLQKKKMISMA